MAIEAKCKTASSKLTTIKKIRRAWLRDAFLKLVEASRPKTPRGRGGNVLSTQHTSKEQ